MSAIPTGTPLPKRVKDIRGVRRGLLVAIKFSGLNERGKASWECRCDCGKTVVVESAMFTLWKHRSCGCYRSLVSREKATKHGMSTLPEYQIWVGIVKRTQNPNSHAWDRYGGRGITLCERWLHSFENFYADMGPRPSKRHSLDRLDNSKGYSPENCAWKTYKEQALNRRSNRRITFRGETLSASQWAERIGISPAAFRNRMDVCGWSIEKAITTPNGRLKKGPLDEFEWAGWRIIEDRSALAILC